MKRLVNAYGLHQASHFLEGQKVSQEALVRWTIVELRWPFLAEFLAAHPQCVAALQNVDVPSIPSIPSDLKELFSNNEVKAVFVNGSTGAVVLDEKSISDICGTANATG